MKRSALLVTILTAVMTLVLPFVGGSGPSFLDGTPANEFRAAAPMFASGPDAPQVIATIATGSTTTALATSSTADAASGTDSRRAAAHAAGVNCPAPAAGTTGEATEISAGGGMITGTTTDDLAEFAAQYNAIRVANCLQPVPPANIRYDSCLEQRLVWMAEDPSTDPSSAWGHLGSARSDGVPSTGCDGNLAGGAGDSGATVAAKWWNSDAHRDSLYNPGYAGATAGVCIFFAMTHGGVPNETANFVRASASWGTC